MIEYFESNIDENNNRLVLALYNYFKCEWSTIGWCVHATFEGVIIKPLVELLGIDENKNEKNEKRNWNGGKEFFEEKLPAIKIISIRENTTNLDKLVSFCAAKVVECLERQIERMSFFSK